MSGDEHSVAVLASADADRAFAVFTSYDRIVLAVSGGADSTALLHLVADWLKRHRDYSGEVIVATVDHGLRAEGSAEARDVGLKASQRGLQHVVKTYAGPFPDGAFAQDWARALRYRLLNEVAREAGPVRGRVAIVTAHHLDDQAETVLMRLARGSGIDGLGAMRAVVRLDSSDNPLVDLVRPLLGISKQQLTLYLTANGCDWVEDPSNANSRFERVQLRARQPARDTLGLTNEKLALSALRAQRASEGLNQLLERAVAAAGGAFTHYEQGYAEMDRGWFEQLVPELRLRLMTRLVHAIGGQDKPVSLGGLEAQADRLLGPTLGREGFSLHGTIVDLAGDRLMVVREPLDARVPRRELPVALGAMALQPDMPGGASPDRISDLIWDNRFSLRLTGTFEGCLAGGLSVGPLCQDGVAELEMLGWQRPAKIPARVLWTQPAIRSLNAVRWAPTVAYAASGAGGCPWDVQFRWQRFDGRATRLG